MRAWHARRKRSHESSASCAAASRIGVAAPASRWWEPLPAAPNVTKIAGLKHVAQSTKDVKAGAGIALFGSLALVPADGKENYVLDISDPSAPKLLSKYEGNERGAAIMA